MLRHPGKEDPLRVRTTFKLEAETDLCRGSAGAAGKKPARSIPGSRSPDSARCPRVGGSQRLPLAARTMRSARSCPEGIRGEIPAARIVRGCSSSPTGYQGRAAPRSLQGHLCGFPGNSRLKWGGETSLDAEAGEGPAALLEVQGRGYNNKQTLILCLDSTV